MVSKAPGRLLKWEKQGCLLHPLLDFICFGGGFILALPILLSLPAEHITLYLSLALVLANFINHPHFAASYQMFYRSFFPIVLSAGSARALKARAVFSGVFVPAAILAFFTYCIAAQNALLIGYAANLMFFLVGWHYVKQGYGLLMLDCALKKCFLSPFNKNLLKVNAYICWLYFWLTANAVASGKNYFGVEYITFEAPALLRDAFLLLLVVFSASSVISVIRAQSFRDKQVPYNGIMAYVLSCYVWLATFLLSPVVLVFIPAFHSLQYLAVVVRCQIGYQRVHAKSSIGLKLILFFVIAFGVGYWGFVGLPSLLYRSLFSTTEAFSPALYVFAVWIFINVHHYFIDSVIWKKENVHALPYLFK